jgi:folate-binding protein YgfZ
MVARVTRVTREAAYRAALEACARDDLSGRELLRVTGPDRVSFVHGMVTNDVEGLAVGASNYAALLTNKGAMVGDVRVLKLDDALVLETGPGRAEAVKAQLLKYLISEDAEVVDAPELAVVGLVGPQAAAWAAKVPGVVGRLESPLGGVDVVVPRELLGEVARVLEGGTVGGGAGGGLPELDAETREVLRVEKGVPEFGVDMGESTIPLEANLGRALHFQKGCYIGQEVIARATYRGQMSKKLVGVLLGEVEAEVKAELKKDGKKVGWLTSVVRSEKRGQVVALGYVHRDFVAEGTALEVGAGGMATVVGLPF